MVTDKTVLLIPILNKNKNLKIQKYTFKNYYDYY